MVRGGVDEDPALLPGSRFDSNILVHGGELLELAVADDDVVLGEQGDVGHVVGPDDVLHFLNLDRSQISVKMRMASSCDSVRVKVYNQSKKTLKLLMSLERQSKFHDLQMKKRSDHFAECKPFLLYVIESDSSRASQKQRSSSRIEDFVDSRIVDLLGDFVLDVLDDDRVGAIEHSEAVTRDPHCRETRGSLAFGS